MTDTVWNKDTETRWTEFFRSVRFDGLIAGVPSPKTTAVAGVPVGPIRDIRALRRKITGEWLKIFGGPALPFPLAILFLLPALNQAHPHMFIDVSAKFVLTDSTLAGFHVYWRFDEMNSAIFTDEYDKNGNNQFEPDEVHEIEKEAFLRVADQNYYTAFVWDNKFYKIRKCEKFNVVVGPDGAVRFSFFVPCEFETEEIIGKEMTLFFEDPSMYIAFTLQKDLIQVSTNERWHGKINFGKIDYVECVHLRLSEK